MRGLRSCPFCGNKKVKIQKVDYLLKKSFYVHCAACNCSGPVKDTNNKAALAWHGRADSQKRIVTPTIELGAVERAGYEGEIRGLKAALKIAVKK